ncbi:MAG: ribonuclease HII, partial [Oscillospiraceae bacterium]|nr:ribonuclease HII [Oscillospiraceae bacterium]
MWEIEQACFAEGFDVVCGVDEAGRGPLAGPVYAAAVILPPNLHIEGLNDSKKVSKKRRDILFDEICLQAIAYGIASADEKEIDEINILQATFLAMRRAIDALELRPSIALIDGN